MIEKVLLQNHSINFVSLEYGLSSTGLLKKIGLQNMLCHREKRKKEENYDNSKEKNRKEVTQKLEL